LREWHSGSGAASWRRGWTDLVQWKIPGSEETYIQRAVALAADFRTRAADYLRPEQATRLGSFDLDLFGITLD
jgi:hypothetical protein